MARTLVRMRGCWCGRIPLVALIFSTVFLVLGCSGLKPYRGMPDHNLHIHTATDSGSFLSSIRVAMDIHEVDPDCRTHYEGTVQLIQPTIHVGIPPHRRAQLVFVFASSSFLANQRGTITYDTLLKPQTGYQYQITVSYKNDIYHVAIRETSPNNPTGLEIAPQPLSACRSHSARS